MARDFYSFCNHYATCDGKYMKGGELVLGKECPFNPYCATNSECEVLYDIVQSNHGELRIDITDIEE